MVGEEDVEVSSYEDGSCSERSSISESEQSKDPTDSYLLIPYGFQSKAYYKANSKSKEITEVTYNSRSRQFIMLDSKGISAWSYNSVVNSVSRLLDYPPYQFNMIRLLLHSKKFNVYFALSKDYALKVFNLNFHEVFSIVSDMSSILCMVFNCVTDELITGGTGGVKFWTFGEIQTKEDSLMKDTRPMANYGLMLSCEHPTIGGSWVKDIILDERTQRLYCLSERNVVAYDMQGNVVFQLKSAHQGLVTSCVFSRFSNLIITGGTDCAVHVWSSSGRYIHSFHGHSKMVTKLLIHPEAPSLVITSSKDGTVKIFSLDIMEEINSHTVFSEGVLWMNNVSGDLLYCASNKGLQVFSINHVANFWATLRCPLKSLSLSSSLSKTRRVIAVAEDNSTRLFSQTSHSLSTVLPPPSITTAQHEKQSVLAHAYTPLYGLMYLLVNDKEIWVYYTKTNPANRVEVWDLSDVRDVNRQVNQRHDHSRARSCSPLSEIRRPSSPSERVPSRSLTSPSLFSSGKIVDGISCLALAFLSSPIILNTNEGEACPDITHFLVAGLQDGRLLFLNPFSASHMYLQLQTTKGAVLSVKHDAAHNSLLLSIITLSEFTIQLRSLPDLKLDCEVNVGNDLTCFVRMDNTILSGYESGRLKLHYVTPCMKNSASEVISGDVARKCSAKKLSKDHFDTVLSVDANSDLHLFCSSSKDGTIKVWDSAKVLLREVVMDASLTAVCFINSAGDLLAGFKNHIFSISHDKVHLFSYSKKTNSTNNFGMFETESDVYEDPRIRFEYKKSIPPEPICMENYLVPFANMSINLARYLSINPSSTVFRSDTASEQDETESELSSLFSVAPTEVYMSQGGTPLSRSRSSSLLSNWELPNLGCSPVSSPPRTPPLVLSPLVESESEVEEETAVSDVTLPLKDRSEELYSVNCKRFQKEQKADNTVNVIPVVTRQKRTGLSQVKIDSRAIRLKANIYRNKRDESMKNMPGGHEDNTESTVNVQQSFQLNATRRPTRAVIKKTKETSIKSSRRIKNRGRLVRSKPENADLDKVGSIVERNERKDTAKLNVHELSEKSVIERPSASRKPDQQNTLDDLNEKRPVSSGFYVITTREEDDKHTLKDVLARKPSVQPDSGRKNGHELGERGFPTSKNDTLVVLNKLVEEQPPSLNNSLWTNAEKRDEVFQVNVDDDGATESASRNELQPVKQQPSEKATSFQKSAIVYEDHSLAQCQPLADITACDESDITKEEFVPSEEKCTLSLSSTDTRHSKDQIIENSIPETVSGMVSENIEGRISPEGSPISRPLPSQRITNKLGRRSASPESPSAKVVSVLDLPLVDEEGGQRLHPSSALKIYALAKTCRKSCSGKSLLSRPRIKRRSFAKHSEIEESFHANHLLEITDDELRRIMINRSAVPEPRRTKIADERKKPREKKDLVKWCLDALSEKGKRPVFSPKPRLRSRRSAHFDKSHANITGKTVLEDFPSRVNNSVDECGKGDGQQNRSKDSEAWKPETIPQDAKRGTWFEEKNREYLRESLCVDKERVKELSQSKRNVGVYGEGWQDRFLERTKASREKRLERERKVLERRRVEQEALEEKRRSVLGVNKCLTAERDVDKPSASPDSNLSEKEEHLKNKSCFESFKNNPAIFQPYRLGKFNSRQEEDKDWVHLLQFDPESSCLAEDILDLLPRPKSAPSIPSKCRKYILVASESKKVRNRPLLTPFEETLMFQRFPKLKFGARARSPRAFGVTSASISDKNENCTDV